MHARILGIALIALGPLVAAAQDAAQDPVQEYESLLRDNRVLTLYNALLERQIATQERDLADVRGAIDKVPDLETGLPPLLIRMVDGLDQFVRLDVPFKTEERTDRVAGLYELIEDAKLSDSQKLRRILEAWAIEVEYGGNYQTDTGTVEIGGAERNVDFLILGRVGMMYQTADDEALTGAWDYRKNQWVELGSEHRNAVRQAIRMARNQIAPDMLLLPVVPPQPN
jgi:hypothetical protein